MICTQPLLYIIELRFYIRVIFDAYVRGLVYKLSARNSSLTLTINLFNPLDNLK